MRASQTSLAAIAAAVALLWVSSAWADGSPPDVNTIVSRMEAAQAANQARMTPYTLMRAYLFDANPGQPKARVIAKVDFQPPATKTFKIEQETGNEHGIKVAQKLLESEAKVASDESKQSSSAISRDNYDFQLVGQQTLNNRPMYVLDITPKKKDKDKVKGQVWVDSTTYLIQRIEGDLVKSPSWWIKDIHLVINYGQMAGLWLQMMSYSVADVRFFGQHSMLIQDLSCESLAPSGIHRVARMQPASPSSVPPPVAAEFVKR